VMGQGDDESSAVDAPPSGKGARWGHARRPGLARDTLAAMHAGRARRMWHSGGGAGAMAIEERGQRRETPAGQTEAPGGVAEAQLSGRRILIIEDEEGIIQLVRLYLEEAGAEVFAASDGVSGLELHVRERPDLIILDVMLPGLDGWEVCRRIRSVASTPIVMLTAPPLQRQPICGLDLGADDYVTKPFSPRELVSRIRAILRRVSSEHQGSPQHPDRLTFPALTIVPAARRVEVSGVPIELTAREFDLLVALACAP